MPKMWEKMLDIWGILILMDPWSLCVRIQAPDGDDNYYDDRSDDKSDDDNNDSGDDDDDDTMPGG